MNKKIMFLSIVFLSILFLSAPASARLAAVGPVNPTNGFPLWYQDTAGVLVDLPAPPLGDVNGLIAPTMIFDAPDGTPFSNQIGFGTEAFYWFSRGIADTGPVGGRAGRAILTMGLEAAFLNGVAVNGEQMVFQRVRIRVDIPEEGRGGTFTVRHPYGTKVFTNVIPGLVGQNDPVTGLRAGINDTVDIGLVPLAFTGALAGPVGPFLRQLLPAPPLGWIGDGVNLATITGSPVGFNAFQVDGPNIGGPGINTISTPLFTTSGHIFPQATVALPLTVDKVAFRRTASQTTLQFFVTSAPGATVTATVPPRVAGGLPITVNLRPGASLLNNTYFGAVTFPNPFTLPASVTVNASLGARTAQVIHTKIVDNLAITRAEYSLSTGRLFVRAVSSDVNAVLSLASPLTVQLSFGRVNVRVLTAPAQVTVSSSSGGVVSAPVTIVP